VGEPGKDYLEENFDRIIDNSAFILHEDTIQKGVYDSIKAGDIILLKYNRRFVAYGETVKKIKVEQPEWNLWATVNRWHFLEPQNRSAGIDIYGIQGNTLEGGGQMGTVKGLTTAFALDIMKKIDSASDLYSIVANEIVLASKILVMQETLELLKFKKQIILQGPPGTGKTRFAQELAFYLIFAKMLSTDSEERNQQLKELEKSDFYRIVQFHPAYSYEDFVRGISAKSNGTIVEYVAENRAFANIAEQANKNLQDSKKKMEDLAKEKWAEEIFEDFKDHVQSEIDKEGRYPLSKSAYIFEIDDLGFRYTGDKWNNDRFRLAFSDLMTLFDSNISNRKEIRTLPVISGSAKQRYSYYFNLLKGLKQFAEGKSYDKLATKIEEKNFVLIIDEINRANLSSVLGELIHALEYRGMSVDCMYELPDGSKQITIPPNLYIIGTMNTADRSIGHIDYAIRRRFAFVNVMSSRSIVKAVGHAKALDLFDAISKLFFLNYDENTLEFNRADKYLSAEFHPEDVMLGHSYFLETDINKLRIRLNYEIKPILNEYLKDGILFEDARSEIAKLNV